MSLYTETKKIMKLNKPLEEYFLSYKDSQKRKVFFGGKKEDNVQENIARILFQLLQQNLDPISFPYHLFVETEEKVGIFPHPRYVNIGKHFHEFIEIVIVIRGKFVQSISGEIITLHRGDICVLHPNTIHSVERSKKEDAIINILVNKTDYELYAKYADERQNIVVKFLKECFFYRNDVMDYIIFRNAINGNIRSILHTMEKLFNNRNKYYNTQMANAANMLIVELMQFAADNKRVETNLSNIDKSRHKLIVKSIENNFPVSNMDTIMRDTNLKRNDILNTLEVFRIKSLDDLIKDVFFERMFFLIKEGADISEIAEKFHFYSERELFSAYESRINKAKVLGVSKETSEGVESINKKSDIISEMQVFYEKMESLGYEDIYDELLDLIDKIVVSSNHNLFTIKVLCIDLCMRFSIRMDGGYLSDNDVKPIAKINELVDAINDAKSLYEVISHSKKYIEDVFFYRTKKKITRNSIVKKAIKIIEDEYLAAPTLQGVAKTISVNPSYLSRLIKAETGKNFTEIVNYLRIEKSKYLLINTNLSMTDIADQSGFSNYTYFYQVFVKTMNMAPKTYRSQNQ